MGQRGSASRLGEDYHLQKVKLGEGSFGTVWRAVARKTGEPVAVKRVDKARLTSGGIEDQRPEIEQETRLLRELSHENIVRLWDVFEDRSSMFIVLEYCDGGDFGDKIQERALLVDEPEAAHWMKQILAAIAFMHARRVCHRDIKPENFLVAGGDTLKLADLGLAVKIARGEERTDRCGTPAFMAPEVAALPPSGAPGGAQAGYGLAVDAWAAGVCMHLVMLGGRHPFLDERGQVDDRRLAAGCLEWRGPASILGRMGLGRPRASREAQQLCQALVEPDQAARLRAHEALDRRWFLLALQHVPVGRAASRRSGDGAATLLRAHEVSTSTSGLTKPPWAPASARSSPAAARPLSVRILSANGLRKADWMGLVAGDPYCTCEVVGEAGGRGPVIQTGVALKSAHPVWNYEAAIADFALCESLLFTVWDKDYLKPDELLGRASLPSREFLASGWKGQLDLSEAGEGVLATLQVEVRV